jgi:hypothetical protein
MTLQLTRAQNGPYVICDQCKAKLNLPANCSWGPKFVAPSLKKLGMKLKGPHVCAQCRSHLSAALRLIPQDNDEVVG